MKRTWPALATILLVSIATTFAAGQQGQAQNQPPTPARSRAEETLYRWNEIGDKLIAMAQDFPEDKYDYKLQKDERTFAQNLLHAAAFEFLMVRAVSGTNVGPDFGSGDNPSREVFKTKADVVKFVQQAVAEGARVIEEQGDAGLDKTIKIPCANKLERASYLWTSGIEHSGEHYGQWVVYYRANNMVPPDSRRQ